MADSQPKPERPKPEPKALTPEYHKARKQLMLWAGVLFIWELVGIDLERAKEAGGNAGAIITAIRSPQAVPWVLLVLVGYFLFKLWVEWSQCEANRRKVVVARIDYGSAWAVATLAGVLYAYQTLSRIQIADVFARSTRLQALVLSFPAGSVVALMLGNFLKFRRKKDIKIKFTSWFLVCAFLMVGSVIAIVVSGIWDWRFVMIGFSAGIPLPLAGLIDWKEYRAKRSKLKSE